MAMSFFTIKPANWKILNHILLMGLVCFFLGSCSSTWNLELEDIFYDDYNLLSQQNMDIDESGNSFSLEDMVNSLEKKCVNHENARYYDKLLNAVLGIKLGSISVEEELSYGKGSYFFPSVVFLAAYLGELGVVAWLVEKCNAEVGKISKDCIFTTVLHAACKGTNLPMLGYLFERLTIEKKSPIAFLSHLNIKGNTYFSEAVAANNVEFVRELISQLKRYQENPGDESEWAEVVNMIVAPSLIGKQRTPSQIAIACGNRAMLSLLKENAIRSDLEKMAIEDGSKGMQDFVEENSMEGDDMGNRQDKNAILSHFEKVFNARKKKKPSYYKLLLGMMAYILEGSTDINAEISARGLYTFNPLCLAVYLEEKEAVKWLLSRGAKPRRKISSKGQYNNKDALCIAFEQVNIEILECLLIHILGDEKYISRLGGSQVGEKDKAWFMIAFKTKDIDLVERVLEKLKKRLRSKNQQSPDPAGKIAKSPRKTSRELSCPQKKKAKTASDKKRNDPINDIFAQLEHKICFDGTDQRYYKKLIKVLKTIKESKDCANTAIRFNTTRFPSPAFFAVYLDEKDIDTIGIIRWLVEQGAKMGKLGRGEKFKTVFHLVCKKGTNVPLLEYLVERLLNEKRSPLNYLLAHLDDEHDNCLNKAIKSNNLAFVRRLVAIIKENSASPTDILELIKQEIPTPLKVAQDAGNLAMQKLLVDEGMYTEEEKPLAEQIRHIHAAT